MTTKIHMLVDSLGRPLRFILTRRHTHAIVAAPALLDGMDGAAVIADKAYDSNDLRQTIADGGMLAVIPPSVAQSPDPARPHPLQGRNRIERCFNKLKHFRRIATRLRNLGDAYLGTPPDRMLPVLDEVM